MKKTMNIVLQIAILASVWAFIALYQAVGTFFFPDRYYSFRAYELARIWTDGSPIPFRPYYVWDDLSNGDLANMAGVPQLKHPWRERFTTDEYGFRNPVGTRDRPCDVVVVGDSFGLGSGTGDDEILSGLIRTRAGLGVYNYCGVPPALFLNDEHFRRNPPALVILFCAERDLKLPDLQFPRAPVRDRRIEPCPPGDYLPGPPYRNIASWRDFYAELNNPHLLRYHAEPIYKGFLYAVGLYRFPPEIFWYDRPHGMFFFKDGGERHLFLPAALNDAKAAAAELKKFKDELARRRVRFLVLVGPDKETIYPDFTPQLRDRTDTTDLLDSFFRELDQTRVDHVRSHDVLAAYREAHPGEWLYFLEDTHLNGLGQSILFDAIRGRLPKKKR